MTSTDSWGNPTQGINYDQFRPVYPAKLRQLALQNLQNTQDSYYLDVATGTGQLLFNLYQNFKQSYGMDLSTQMVQVSTEKAKKVNEKCPNKITVRQSDCLKVHEHTLDTKFKLVTVGQALHWFRIDDFIRYTKECLLVPEGTFAVMGYYITHCQFLDVPVAEKEEANKIYYDFYDKIEPYFAFRMKELDQVYTEEKYTFAKYFTDVHKEVISERMDLSWINFLKFCQTYSGYNNHLKQTGVDLAVEMEEKLKCKGKNVGMWVKYFIIRCRNH